MNSRARADFPLPAPPTRHRSRPISYATFRSASAVSNSGVRTLPPRRARAGARAGARGGCPPPGKNWASAVSRTAACPGSRPKCWYGHPLVASACRSGTLGNFSASATALSTVSNGRWCTPCPASGPSSRRRAAMVSENATSAVVLRRSCCDLRSVASCSAAEGLPTSRAWNRDRSGGSSGNPGNVGTGSPSAMI